MKKFSIILIILLLGAVIFLGKEYLDNHSKAHDLVDLQTEQEQELEDTYIDPAAIINDELQKVGIITVFEGKATWAKSLEEENWYSFRGAIYKLVYSFGLACDLKSVETSYEGDVVNITVNPHEIYLQYLELDNSQSIMHSEASWLAEKYTAQEINAIQTVAYRQVEEHIIGKKEYWDEAYDSLKANIVKICNDLGYTTINFNEGTVEE